MTLGSSRHFLPMETERGPPRWEEPGPLTCLTRQSSDTAACEQMQSVQGKGQPLPGPSPHLPSFHHRVTTQAGETTDRALPAQWLPLVVQNWDHEKQQGWSSQGFSGGSDGQESACQCRKRSFYPWAGKIPWRRQRQPNSSILAWEIP